MNEPGQPLKALEVMGKSLDIEVPETRMLPEGATPIAKPNSAKSTIPRYGSEVPPR
jgi:hypothetical protein